MNIEDFEKLEKEIKKQDFNNSYSRINKVLSILSIAGNFFSIFLAYFFLSKLFTDSVTAITSPIIIGVISVLILGGLELLKREVFDKWSLEFIRAKYKIKKEVSVLITACLIVVAFSAYSSMSGAQEFSSKNEVLVEQADVNIDQYSDSLNVVYYDKINLIESQNKILFDQNVKYDDDISKLPENYISEKKRIRAEKRVNEETIEKNEGKVDRLKDELEDKITSYEEEITSDVSTESKENKDDSFIFIFISALIEIVILIGIFFNKVYKFVSYTDFKERVGKDPNYQKWIIYSEVLRMIFPPGSKLNDKMPTMTTLLELAKIQNINLNQKELTGCMKLFNSLKITKSSGPVKYLNKDKDQAEELLKNHFKLD